MAMRPILLGLCLSTVVLVPELLQAHMSTPNAEANPAAWPAAHSPKAMSSVKDEARIDALLASMTVEQKVGQMIQADISAITPEDLTHYPLGSILAGGNSGPYGDERADARKWAKLVDEFRVASRKSGAGIPILFGIDAVHGHSNLPGATIFPHNIGLGAAHDPHLIRRIGAATAAEVAGSGIDWTFAPTLAVPQDLRWGRSYEGYSADPKLVAAYSKAMTEGLQGVLRPNVRLGSLNVAASAKHFLADGGTAGGKDQGDAQISETELIAKHAQGYPAAIDAGALTVMVSFSSWNGVKNHGNKSLITAVLKDRMGFDGLVVGDWNGHGQVPGCTPTDCAAAFNAGMDLAMAPDSWKGLFESTVRDVRSGKIAMSRVDDAVRRILRVKIKLGLLDPTPVKRADPSQIGAPEHLAVAREAVAKSLVLLKNNGSVLPIRPGARVLIAGPGADNMAMQTGGWTITWQGNDTTAADFPEGRTIGRAITEAVSANGGQAFIATDGKWSEKPDVAIVVLGEQPYAEFQGDVHDLAFRIRPEDEQLVADLKAKGIPVVTVFLSGRPMFVGKLLNQSDAFVAAWLPGSQGQGVADVLVAQRGGKTRREFSGHLPFAWPADARSPVTQALFPLGYGLSYRKSVTVGLVNEEPGVDLNAASSETSYFLRGKTLSKWQLNTDSVVGTRAVDLASQEDARQFTWTGKGGLAIFGPPVDLTTHSSAGFALMLDWRYDNPSQGPVTLGLGGGEIDITRFLAALPKGTRTTSRIALRCFQDAGANLKAVTTPLNIRAEGNFAVTIRNIWVEQVSEPLTCP